MPLITNYKDNQASHMEITLKELGRRLDARIVGDENLTITAVAGLEEAQSGDISFLANPRYEDKLAVTQASAVIVSGDIKDAPVTLLVASNPYVAFAKVLEIFCPEKLPDAGLSSQAWIDPTAEIGEGVTLFPFAYIGQMHGLAPVAYCILLCMSGMMFILVKIAGFFRR